MGLSNNAVTRLAQEGLAQINDFADFKEEQLLAAFKNMRTAIPGLPAVPEQVDAAGNTTAPAIPAVAPILPVLVSAKCAKRLIVASVAYHYYESIGRDVTPANMNYTNVLKAFHIEYEAIVSLSNEEKPKVPTLHKNTTPLRWIESFKDCLYRTYGLRNTPLLYVI